MPPILRHIAISCWLDCLGLSLQAAALACSQDNCFSKSEHICKEYNKCRKHLIKSKQLDFITWVNDLSKQKRVSKKKKIGNFTVYLSGGLLKGSPMEREKHKMDCNVLSQRIIKEFYAFCEADSSCVVLFLPEKAQDPRTILWQACGETNHSHLYVGFKKSINNGGFYAAHALMKDDEAWQKIKAELDKDPECNQVMQQLVENLKGTKHQGAFMELSSDRGIELPLVEEVIEPEGGGSDDTEEVVKPSEEAAPSAIVEEALQPPMGGGKDREEVAQPPKATPQVVPKAAAIAPRPVHPLSVKKKNPQTQRIKSEPEPKDVPKEITASATETSACKKKKCPSKKKGWMKTYLEACRSLAKPSDDMLNKAADIGRGPGFFINRFLKPPEKIKQHACQCPEYKKWVGEGFFILCKGGSINISFFLTSDLSYEILSTNKKEDAGPTYLHEGIALALAANNAAAGNYLMSHEKVRNELTVEEIQKALACQGLLEEHKKKLRALPAIIAAKPQQIGNGKEKVQPVLPSNTTSVKKTKTPSLENQLQAYYRKARKKARAPSKESTSNIPAILTVSFIASMAAVIIWALLPKKSLKTKRKTSKKMTAKRVKRRTKVSSKGQTRR